MSPQVATNGLKADANGASYMLMSDLTHRLLTCKAHLNMSIENALYKFITITITFSFIETSYPSIHTL